jgi:hypothetical protein
MPETIRDGTGGGHLAHVTSENKLRTYATIESEVSYESETNERAYSWTSSYNYDANDTILLLKNTSSTKNLIIDAALLSSDTTTQFISHYPSGTTLAGTEVTGVNLNRTSNLTAEVSCYQDETGNSRGDIEVQGFILANTSIILPFSGSVILGINSEFAIDFVTAGTLGMVSIRGYFHEVI